MGAGFLPVPARAEQVVVVGVNVANSSLTLGSARAHAGSSLRIGETLLFGSGQRVFLDQDSLAFVAVASTTEAYDDRFEGGVAPGPPRQSCVAAG